MNFLKVYGLWFLAKKRQKTWPNCVWGREESHLVLVLSKEKTKNTTELRVRPRGKSSCFGRGLLIHLEFLAVFNFIMLFKMELLSCYFWGHPFITHVKFSSKLTFFIPDTHTYQGVRNVNFSENFAHVLNKRSLC